MKAPRAPRLDERRASDFAAELRERAQAWIPSWELADTEGDFGNALLQIAARLNSEVAEHLDRSGEKMRRGFLDWLAVRGQAARPARMPVVFKLADNAREAVLAEAPVRMQADAAGTPVVFETEKDVRVVPGRLDVIVGVDAGQDAFYLPAPGLSDLQPLEPLPTQWQLKSFAASGATKLQLDPEAGLVVDLIVEAAGQQYRTTKVDKEIVTIEPALAGELPAQTIVRKVTSFDPFGGVARDRQEHALYFGHMELFDIESPATITIVGAQELRGSVTWQYWGKVDPGEDVGWQTLSLHDTQPGDAVVLMKPKGAIEPREMGAGRNSRWIRGFTKNVPAGQQPFHASQLTIRINAVGCGTVVPCPPTAETTSPAAEGMTNSTPLVLESVFFPLGKEPRQFDAFYLGSVEAFSKKGAEVQLCFEMAAPTFASLTRAPGLWGSIVAGVAADRSLHLFQLNSGTRMLDKLRDREPLQPPNPGPNGQAVPGNAIPLDMKPLWRLPVWLNGPLDLELLVGTTSGPNVWIWREKLDQTQSGWETLGQVPAKTQSSQALVDGLVYLDDAVAPKLMALRDGVLSSRDWPNGTQWVDVDPRDGANNPVTFKSIVPVLVRDPNDRLVTSAMEGMVGISDTNALYHVDINGACQQRLVGSTFDFEIRPAAVRDGPIDLAFVAVDTANQLVAFHDTAAAKPPAGLEPDARISGSLDVVFHDGEYHFLTAVALDSGGYLASWAPFDATAPDDPFKAAIPASVGQVGGSPTAMAADVIVTGMQADVFLAELDLSNRFAPTTAVPIEPGIVVPASGPALVPNDIVTRMLAGIPEPHLVTGHGNTRDGEVLHPIDSFFTNGATGPLMVYRNAMSFTGSVNALALNTLILDPADQEATENTWVLANGIYREIMLVNRNVSPWEADVMPAFLGPVAAVTYRHPLPTGGRVAPFMDLDPSTTGDWDKALLDRVKLLFPNAVPEQQSAKAFTFDSNDHPILVALATDFTVLPAGVPTFVVDAAVGEWARLLGDTSSNPELSWEYWNGKGWWKLDVTFDATLHLKSTGAVQFKVPNDIASSDWAGRTNHWIRARLVGGDYGQQQVTVKTTPTSIPGETVQTITRSSAGIRAPSVVKLRISYRLCDGVQPKFVLAQDSGSLRDQSDANRTAGAIVEAFVPLAITVARLSGPAATATAHECPPPCQCGSESAAATVAAVPADSTAAMTAGEAGSRSLFVGLSAALSGAPVNILLLVEKEAPHETFAPMTVEALVADRFAPVVAEDGTRALGESGLISMAFAVQPTPRELFGMENLTWLRLTPAGSGPVTDWKPTLRGAYLNAVWASATETLTRELLGSSDGAPHLTVRLARPPVLHNTLELRVKEPLGEEERAALVAKDANSVLSAVEGLRGDWVLWKQVIDPDDEPPAARVYALDESNGEIRFGDGLHGAIPPIGRDSIVAFRYSRTEPDPAGGDRVPGNSIAARAPLNLVSPVESVEAVIVADQAAGGAPPESDDRVLRFGFARFRHRGRAVTPRDLEDLALQSSPDIVQARAVVRRGSIRLVVVMRGTKPQPNAAQVRELRRLLLAAGPASLSAPGALRIEGPAVRRLRIELKLRVETLDNAGALTELVKKRLTQFFDTATGGNDRDGWPMGVSPSADDIALVLLDAPHLEGIADITLIESSDGALKETELVTLADDPIRIEFETAEVTA